MTLAKRNVISHESTCCLAWKSLASIEVAEDASTRTAAEGPSSPPKICRTNRSLSVAMQYSANVYISSQLDRVRCSCFRDSLHRMFLCLAYAYLCTM